MRRFLASPAAPATSAAILAASLLVPAPVSSQDAAAVRVEVTPERLDLDWRASGRVTVRALDAAGRAVSSPVRVTGPRTALSVERAGDGWTVTGLEAGEHTLVVVVGASDPVVARVPVQVGWPPVRSVEVGAGEGTLYEGVRLPHEARVVQADGRERPDARPRWRSSDPSVATVDDYGAVRAVGTGTVTITASVDGVEGSATHTVRPLPVVRVELEGAARDVRTGDVLSFRAVARDGSGRVVEDVPVTWSSLYRADDSIRAPSAVSQLEDGRFVAQVPGVHTVVATVGPRTAERSFRVRKRDVVRPVRVQDHGRLDVYTTDLWLWEGVDGRDYAITGSKTDGKAFVFDVTDPTNLVLTDSIRIDARSVNDVKIAPNGRWGALSREGASDRRNGVVVLDLADPAHPRIASHYTEGLTGGVHNMYATDTHLFALSNGDKYVILDMADLAAPRYVSEYDHPDSRVHDVWVHDGVAYSAEWGTGIVVVDVGNGRWGGSIENPVLVTTYPLPSGSTHAVFPYLQESTGTFYLVAGDEDFDRTEMAWQGTGPDFRQPYDPTTGRGGYPRASTGYIQFVDFSDPENPEMVARYEVPEFGTHNMWVEDDILYEAYYEGGVRMVDISGDLMGNLYTQDREIAVFKAHDPIGYIPNSPGAWSVIPWKGSIFFSDINSGLWSVRLAPERRPVS